jgi:hypothetical protein
MKEKIKKESIAPTLTLAQLYDSQNQLFNALNIYNKLLGVGDDTEINQRINGIYEKLVDKEFDNYQSFLKQIFSKKDLIKFRILTNSQYSDYIKSMKDLESENEEGTEEIADKNEDIKPNLIDEDVQDVLEEKEIVEPEIVVQQDKIEKNTAVKEQINEDAEYEWQEMKLGNLMDFILLKIDRERELGSISLKEIKEIFDLFKK